MKNLREKAKDYAYEKHSSVNHFYDGLPYAESHLKMVVEFIEKYIYLIPENKRDLLFATGWLHDVLEDVHSITFGDIKKEFGDEIAEIVYACTNEKGRTRKERANEKYYQGIRETPYATFIKLCDRFANLTYSLQSGSSMAEKYKKENPDFMVSVYVPGYDVMFEDLGILANG